MLDISTALIDFDSILPSFSSHSRQLIGGVAIRNIRKRIGWKKLHVSYAREVLEGKSCFTINWQGEVERVVSIIALRLLHTDGRILAHIGEWDGDRIHASCRLIGKKQKHGETPHQTRTRLLRGVLAPIAHAIRCTHAELNVVWKESKRMDVKTKYLRTVNHAELTCAESSLGLEDAQIAVMLRERE